MPKAQSALEARLFERLKDPQIIKDCETLGLMTEIYCKDHHQDADRVDANTPAVFFGAYQNRQHPKLCPSCNNHLIYGELRRALCPYNPKPNCKNCKTHCYKTEEQKFQQDLMRYVGPRALLYPHLWKDTVRHLKNTMGTSEPS